jgi:hypothetical protein
MKYLLILSQCILLPGASFAQGTAPDSAEQESASRYEFITTFSDLTAAFSGVNPRTPEAAPAKELQDPKLPIPVHTKCDREGDQWYLVDAETGGKNFKDSLAGWQVCRPDSNQGDHLTLQQANRFNTAFGHYPTQVEAILEDGKPVKHSVIETLENWFDKSKAEEATGAR